MRRAAPLLALAALAAAGEPLRLPAASEAKRPPGDAVAVDLSADGQIVVLSDGRSDTVSLDRLGLWLRDRTTRFDEQRKANGGSGFTKLPKGFVASEMPVLLRVDEAAPWGHVQRLLLACAEAKIHRIGFGVKGAGGEEGQLAAGLPVDREPAPAPPPQQGPGQPPPPADPHGSARILVRVEATKEEPAVWGPTQARISKPSEITFRLGESDAMEIEKVRRYIRDASQTANATNPDAVKGEIRAAARIPFGVVVSVLNEYHRAGIRSVEFQGGPVPTPEERRMGRLDYPSR